MQDGPVLIVQKLWPDLPTLRTTSEFIRAKNRLAVFCVIFLVMSNKILINMSKLDTLQEKTLVLIIKSINKSISENKVFWISIRFCCQFLVNFLQLLQIVPIKIGGKLWACSFCSQTQKSPAEVRRHILVHTGEKPFSCHLCSYACNRNFSLQIHLKKKHNLYVWQTERACQIQT